MADDSPVPHASGRGAVTALHAALFEHLPDAYLALDASYRVVAANRRYLRVTGMRMEDVLGVSIFEINQLAPAEQREQRDLLLRDAFARAEVDAPLSFQLGYELNPAARSAVQDPSGTSTGAQAGDTAMKATGRGKPSPRTDSDVLREVFRSRTSNPGRESAADRTDSVDGARGKNTGNAGDASAPFDVANHWDVQLTRTAALSEDPSYILRLTEITAEVRSREIQRREHVRLLGEARSHAQLVKDTQARLTEEKLRLEEALAFANIGSWDMNPHTGDIDCTDQCKANYGLAPSDSFSEKRLFDSLMDVRDRSRVQSALAQGLAKRTPFQAEYRTTWPDGSLHWIHVLGRGRYDGERNLVGISGLSLDITERKEREIAQKAMMLAERDARHASDRRVADMDGFVSAVSHELRSPLHAILSWSQLMQRMTDLMQAVKAGNTIERNARQLSHMVDDLLDTGAIINGKLSVQLAPLDLGALAGLVAEDSRLNAEAKGLNLRFDNLQSCMVSGDADRLRQIIWNLLTNAAKFTRHGIIDLSVRPDQDAGLAVLTVEDTGVGIAPDALTAIFDRFRQAEESDSGRVGGLGLGLWLVRSLAQLHDGSVEAYSEGPMKGSRFVVKLPLLR